MSSPQTAVDLRRRALRLREIAREFPTDETATRLRGLAGELDERAATQDLQLSPMTKILKAALAALRSG